ncbi:MAG TPA: kinase [Planctomycetota bacterium]|nr:kinase [Planctomycetota bacterium]
MIISRTPFRISFFGGGTDYPAWYHEHGGAVLATSINKYCYISCRHLPPFFDYKSRILYSKIELVKSPDEIQHPSVRAALQYLKINDGIEIHHDGDLPARTGLGSSSTFTVGLLHSLYALRSRMVTKMQLARDAIHIEHDVLKESVGAQDQVITAHGGLHRIDFSPNDDFSLSPIVLRRDRLVSFQNHCMLVFTGFTRTASEIAAEQIRRTGENKSALQEMYKMVSTATDILKGDGDIGDFGRLLHENWLLKRSLSSRVSTSEIDTIYEAGREAGALGGKVLGAGGGGFFLFFARPEEQASIRAKLDKFLHVPFRFETLGSQIIHYEPFDQQG